MLFLYELKKIWSIKVLLIIAVFAVLTWFALLAEGINTYESLRKHGGYGPFQNEMFGLYGDTLEPEEIEDFDFARRFAEIAAAGDIIIARESELFAKYGLANFLEYIEWSEDDDLWLLISGSEEDEIMRDKLLMDAVMLERSPITETQSPEEWWSAPPLDEWYESPFSLWYSLKNLENRYVTHIYHETHFINLENRPVVRRAAKEILERENNSLIPNHLMDVFSLYAATAGVFAVAAVMLLVIPLLITDRSRKINMLQYSSMAGRKVFKIQFAATLTSAFILSLILTAVLFAPLVKAAAEYWNASIFHGGIVFVWLYDITFGQYVLLLAGMIIASCVGAAGFAFILARFSSNIVGVMIKAVPAGATLCVLTAYAVNLALADMNFFFNAIFGGRFDMPEIIVCGAIGLVGVTVSALVVRRERRVDLL